MRTAWVVTTALGVLQALGGCLGEGEPGGTGLEVAVAPLQLDGITDARYTIAVTNAPGGAGELVWSRTVTSDQYGDGAGAITYVGTCDAGKRHTVTLTLEALFTSGGELSAATYVNPTPVRLEADCLENRDTPVRFDITLMREADQGFFDVAVQFEDIFCSAKLDCQSDSGGDLDLLFNGASRDMTAVLGFACASGEGQTFLYMDDLVIDCGGTLIDVRVAPVGLGATTLATNPNDYLFAAATYRGLGDGGVAYWNVALGLDAQAFSAMGACSLKTRATASSTAWDQEPSGFPLPPATVYPVIVWDVPLTSATGRVCTRHEVGSDEVAVDYVGYLPIANAFTWSDDVVYMQHRLTPGAGGGVVLSAGTPICNPSCVNGTCVADGVCQCGPGWDGARCDEPVCVGGCGTGVCIAPGSCNCAGTGFTGANCQTDIDECATNNGGCAQDCNNTGGSFACDCTVGYTLNADGVSCDDVDECLNDNGGCSANATCTNTAGSSGCACNPGYVGDGVSCVAAYASCLDAKDSGETESKVYVVDPDGAGPIAAQSVYCDMVTDGGGWTLMAKFTQHQGVNLLPQATYENYFGATGGALWIEGNAMARPSSPMPSYDTYRIESLDWREHLTNGRRYQLRQHAFKGAGTATFDVRYAFTHQGHVKQDGVSPTNLRAWSLEGRQVLTDNTGISWSSETSTLFWLPFGSGATDSLYTGCGGSAFAADGCGKSNAASRRYGNAGIIGAAQDATDPAFAWAPHTNTSQTYDWVYVHQAPATYGTTGGQLALLYWVREESCTTNAQCASGLCEGDGTCLPHQPSCMALREAGVTTSGTYTLDRDGAAGAAAPVQAYCDMVTDGGGWMYVGEPGRSTTNIADTYIANAGDYHRFVYDLRGFTYDQALIVRPSGYYWCDSWGSDATYWGPGAMVSMGIAHDTATFNYHNGQTSPYAWIEVPYSQSTSCSTCWTTNNTKPSLVNIAALDGPGSTVKLDPPGSQLAHLEVSNFDAFVNQAGGCNLTGGRQATWRAFVRAAPSGHFGQFHGGAQTFAANGWTAATFSSAPIASGVSVSGANLSFGRTGVYRVTLSYRPGAAGNVWTGVRLFGDGATQGVSAGHGNFTGGSPELQTAEFLATVPNTSGTYQIQVGRLASTVPVAATTAINEIITPSVQATVERVDDLVGGRSHAQLQGAAQTFAANAWTAASWNDAPRLQGVAVNGANLSFAETGVYRVTLSYRLGTGGDVWTAVGLFGDGVVKGLSAGHGNVTDSHELFTTSFLANVDNTAATWQLRVGRLSSAIAMDHAQPIAGVALPSVQATIVKESGVATSYAQLHGGAQTFAAGAWTSASFGSAPVAANISVSGANITVNEPGVYRVTLSYRQGVGADVWTAVRLFGNGVTAGLSAGHGNAASSPELFTTSFLATVIKAGTYHIQIGRLAGPVTVLAPNAIVGITPPAVQATLVKVR